MTDSTALFRHLQALLERGEDLGDHHHRIFSEYGRTVAVMVIDSVGFSRVAKQAGILQFLSGMVKARDLIGPVLRVHGALDVRFEADNTYAAFDHANAALMAARAVHQAVSDSGLVLSADEPYQVCIGIGYGEMLDGGSEGFFGDQMNLASKLGEDIAEGGETLITCEARSAADGVLLEGFVEEFVTIAGLELNYLRHRG